MLVPARSTGQRRRTAKAAETQASMAGRYDGARAKIANAESSSSGQALR